MRFVKKKNDNSTIRVVTNDDKTIRYGVVGKVGDLLTAHILDYCDYTPDTWLFIARSGSGMNDKFAATCIEATSDIEQ